MFFSINCFERVAAATREIEEQHEEATKNDHQTMAQLCQNSINVRNLESSNEVIMKRNAKCTESATE